ncbi:MAG: hypothetical protein HC806_09435 [Anaerolineae bacterium]|nr:hypothetical protein [Anaerolineae bacterium]
MKTTHYLYLVVCLLLAGCTAILPQTSEPESGGENVPSPGLVGVVVEEVVEVGGQSYSFEGEFGPTTVEIVGGDEAALREFIERWLGSTYPGQPEEHITVYLASLPPDMWYSVPIPEGARLVASVWQTRFEFLQLLLDVPLPQEDVAAYFDEALPEAGWQPSTDAGQGGGFVSHDAAKNYCLDEETYLNLIVAPLEDGQTDVRIYIQGNNGGYSPCAPYESYAGSSYTELIPLLKAPPGILTTSGGGGSTSGQDSYTEAHLQGNISPAELSGYYDEQLIAAGWTLIESGGEESTGWSYWSLKDEKGEEWFGTLIVTKVPPDSDKIFAYIRVSRGQ